MTFEEMKNLVQSAGISGCGGAGFPSYAKLDKRADTIILNCAECEPLFKVHRQLLEKKAYEICSALDVIAECCEAEEFIIALKGEYKDAVDAVSSVLPLFKKGKISLLPSVYPAGDELITIYESTGRAVKAGQLPISVGVIVFNTETVYNIYRAVNASAPVTHKLVTVAGEVKNPQTFYAPLGTSFKELIDKCGGKTRDDVRILSGGPMTGKLASAYDTVGKTTNGILVLPKSNPVIVKRETNATVSVMRTKSACCQCRSCTDLCPRNLLGHPIDPAVFMRSVSTGNADNTSALIDAMYCVSCGVCEMYACPQGLNPRSLLDEYKKAMRARGVKIPPQTGESSPNAHRAYRRLPMKRLVQRLGLSKYDIEAPLCDESIEPKRLKISLSQHIGVPAKATVQKGDIVNAGTVLAKNAEGALSLPIHSPVLGTVIDVNDEFIVIDAM